jgi:hypothetical protein
MRALTATGIVNPDHTLTLRIPSDIPPGPQTVIVVLDDSINTHSQRSAISFNPHPVGPADPACTYRREDLYGDDGR